MITLLIIVIAAVAIAYAGIRHRRRKMAVRTLPGLAEQAESTARHAKEWLESSPVGRSMASEKKAFKAMSGEYAELKERYSYDEDKLWPLITDWWAYNDALMEIIHAREMLDSDSSPDAHAKYERMCRLPYAKKHEIEGRYLRSVREEQRKQTESAVENG